MVSNKKTKYIIMKIGIITEIKENGKNYGGILQALALNRFLNSYENCQATTLHFSDEKPLSYRAFIYTDDSRLSKKIKRIISPVIRQLKIWLAPEIYDKDGFNKFIGAEINLDKYPISWHRIIKSDYDIFIVGSDVVWTQTGGLINRIKFLDFKNKKNTKKYAYAASFGENHIPNINVSELKRCLLNFDGITVRELSAVKLLKSIGVINSFHVCDPTQLYTSHDWLKYEEKPNKEYSRYIFCYLLGSLEEDLKKITCFAQKSGLKIIVVNIGNVNKDFGDIILTNCSIGEWLWYIHNAEYVFADSFHGIVFSTIFEKKFVYIKRNNLENRNINIRITDYLNYILQEDKELSNINIEKIDKIQWDYTRIKSRMETLRNISIEYLSDIVAKEI